MRDKRALSIIGGLLIFFLVGITIVAVYNFFGKSPPPPEGEYFIYYVAIYLDKETNEAALSISVGNTGTVDFTVVSIKLGEDIYELPVEGMIGTNKVRVGERNSFEFPLRGTYKVGEAYEISIETDPLATSPYKTMEVPVVSRE